MKVKYSTFMDQQLKTPVCNAFIRGMWKNVIRFRLPVIYYSNLCHPQRGQNYEVRKLVKKNKAAVCTLYSVIVRTICTPPT